MSQKLSKQEKDHLNGWLVLLTSLVILYTLLLCFLQKMGENSSTVNGALTFLKILRWGGLVGAMLCAAWGAYKENRGFFAYAGICLYLFGSATIILFCGPRGTSKAFALNYLALLATFILLQVYFFLRARGPLSKTARTVLTVASAVVILAVIAAALFLRFA